MIRTLYISCFAILLLMAPCIAKAGPSYGSYTADFPESHYIVGIGEASVGPSDIASKRIAEVLARRDIASQVRVRVAEVSVDLMCSASSGDTACKDSVVTVIEATVDEMLRGSRIIDSGKADGMFFAVAVMPRSEISHSAGQKLDQAIEEARAMVSGAKGPESIEMARKSYMKARVYELEQQVFGGAGAPSSALDEVRKALEALE